MYGQMTAVVGSISARRESSRELLKLCSDGRQRVRGDLSNKLVVSGGMGGMGGRPTSRRHAQWRAVLGIDVDPARIERRVQTGTVIAS